MSIKKNQNSYENENPSKLLEIGADAYKLFYGVAEAHCFAKTDF